MRGGREVRLGPARRQASPVAPVPQCARRSDPRGVVARVSTARSLRRGGKLPPPQRYFRGSA